MNKLVFAGFARLKKDLAFWVCFWGMAALGVYLPVAQYFDSLRYNTVFAPDDLVFNYTPFICIAAAVFISLYLGIDYSDGSKRDYRRYGGGRAGYRYGYSRVCGIYRGERSCGAQYSHL